MRTVHVDDGMIPAHTGNSWELGIGMRRHQLGVLVDTTGMWNGWGKALLVRKGL